MKFDCGPSPETTSVAQHKAAEKECERLRNWHSWFAWHPVRVGEHDCRWLERVERRFPGAWKPLAYPEVGCVTPFISNVDYRAKETT